MTKKIVILALVALCVFALAACRISTDETADTETDADSTGNRIVVEMGDNVVSAHTLTVTATGSVSVMPDVAYITAGVMTQNADMATAQSDNKDVMNGLWDALKAAGLTEDDMRTIDYSAYPMYDYSDDREVITGYQVTNTVQLTINDIDSVGEFLDIAAENGANTRYSIQFTLQDEDAYYNDALADAMTVAKSKADAIAAAGGHEIKGTLEIVEGSSSYYVTRSSYDVTADEAEAATPITTSELDVTAQVTIVYEIN